jgi:hypothetical protein
MLVAMAKEAVNISQDMNLQQGLHFERRMFHSTFATVCFFIFLLIFLDGINFF